MELRFVVSAARKISASFLALVLFAGCASLRSTSSNRLEQRIAHADAAYRSLNPSDAVQYNNALGAVARRMVEEPLDELRAELSAIGVKLDAPQIKLPLARFQVAPFSPDASHAVGVPMLLDYDTADAPLYPRDGLTISATAIYRRVADEPHLSLVTGKRTVQLNGSSYPLKIDNVAPVTAMARRARHVLGNGLSYMLHPAAMRDKTGIFLTEPYDPNKIPVLMVHGLKSSPFAFFGLIEAIRRDPELSQRFQVWTYFYSTATPVLFNALELRQALEKTVRELDPRDRDFATQHIVVLGHSMGGLLAHTLVSTSGEKLWNALFVVPPQRLHGDSAAIRALVDTLHFRANPRVVRVIFAATPHRGSSLAESWIGRIAASRIRLSPLVKSEVANLMSENPDAATPAAKAFHREMNFTSVRTLSPRDPALNALVDLAINVPFHSVIGQYKAGPVETSSDGFVPYASSHLDGATSERIVRSGHGVCANQDGEREIVRILRLELEREHRSMPASYAEKRNRVFHRDLARDDDSL